MLVSGDSVEGTGPAIKGLVCARPAFVYWKFSEQSRWAYKLGEVLCVRNLSILKGEEYPPVPSGYLENLCIFAQSAVSQVDGGRDRCSGRGS